MTYAWPSASSIHRYRCIATTQSGERCKRRHWITEHEAPNGWTCAQHSAVTDREVCGAPHPYAGEPCARPSGHDGDHGNAERAWLTAVTDCTIGATEDDEPNCCGAGEAVCSPSCSAPKWTALEQEADRTVGLEER